MATSFYGGDYFGGEFFSGAVPDELIGRKYPSRRRRGIYHPRKKVVEVVEVLKEVREEKDYAQELLAAKHTELQLTKLQAHNGVNRANRLNVLAGQIQSLETDLMRMREEEEMLMLLSFVALEM